MHAAAPEILQPPTLLFHLARRTLDFTVAAIASRLIARYHTTLDLASRLAEACICLYRTLSHVAVTTAGPPHGYSCTIVVTSAPDSQIQHDISTFQSFDAVWNFRPTLVGHD
jgi:hypothetical protein